MGTGDARRPRSPPGRRASSSGSRAARGHQVRRAPATAATAVAAACLEGPLSPAAEPGRGTDGPGPRRRFTGPARGRGLGRARVLREAADLAAVPRHLSPAARGAAGAADSPRRLPASVGRLDAVIAGACSLWPGCGRAEVSALRWARRRRRGPTVDGISRRRDPAPRWTEPRQEAAGPPLGRITGVVLTRRSLAGRGGRPRGKFCSSAARP